MWMCIQSKIVRLIPDENWEKKDEEHSRKKHSKTRDFTKAYLRLYQLYINDR